MKKNCIFCEASALVRTSFLYETKTYRCANIRRLYGMTTLVFYFLEDSVFSFSPFGMVLSVMRPFN